MVILILSMLMSFSLPFKEILKTLIIDLVGGLCHRFQYAALEILSYSQLRNGKERSI